jgi:flagellar biosynthesis/type III secretory pathway protein FliH
MILKDTVAIINTIEKHQKLNPNLTVEDCIKIIDNALTVEPETSRLALIEDIRKKQMDADKAFLEGYETARKKYERPQGDITEEDVQNAIKAGYENGYSMAQAKYQRPQGEWIRCADHYYYKCSICGDTWFYEESKHFQYCPKCGAQMVENDG